MDGPTDLYICRPLWNLADPCHVAAQWSPTKMIIIYGLCIVVKDKNRGRTYFWFCSFIQSGTKKGHASCSTLYHLQFTYVVIGKRVPDDTGTLQDRPYKGSCSRVPLPSLGTAVDFSEMLWCCWLFRLWRRYADSNVGCFLLSLRDI